MSNPPCAVFLRAGATSDVQREMSDGEDGWLDVLLASWLLCLGTLAAHCYWVVAATNHTWHLT